MYKKPGKLGLAVVLLSMLGCSASPNQQASFVSIALEKPMDMDVEEWPLFDAIEFISKDQGLNIQFAFNASPDIEPAVTCSAKGKPVRVVLEQILKPIGLTYFVSGEVIMVVKL